MSLIFSLPFESGFLDIIAGRTLVLASNHRGENEYDKIKEITVGKDGTCNDGVRLEVFNGTLRLFDRDKLFCIFSEIGTNGKTTFAVGYSTLEVSRHGFDRLVLYERANLNSVNFGVCISSHVKYEAKTLPVILESLEKSGIEPSRILVVVGGDKQNDGKEDIVNGVLTIRRNLETMGFIGISETSKIKNIDYWILLHDTCNVDLDFADKVGKTDIGLMPDIVLFNPVEKESEIGIYETDFLSKIDVGTNHQEMFSNYMLGASTVMVVESKPEPIKEKDVYGNGNKRKIISLSTVGVKKYEGRIARGGRP